MAVKKTTTTRPKPLDTDLYEHVKRLANKRFKSKSGIYRSSWIVREYKARGGRYSGRKNTKTGLLRWYDEKWIDLNRPTGRGKYAQCGRPNAKGKYPLCRPSKRITSKTPLTYKEIPKSVIVANKRIKAKVKGTKNVKFAP